jgi:xylan 1,4-beta-xylosidase
MAASAAGAETLSTVDVRVDATADGPPLEVVWPFHGYDEINDTTTAEGRALLGALAGAHAAPIHVRSHFLFNTGDGTPAMKWGSTNVYTEDASGNPVYDWALTDGIFDTLAGVGALPFVELGFMPQALSTHPIPYPNSSKSLLDGGSFFPPTDYGKWQSLIRTWASHAKDRYPDVEAKWLWELWNEPDIGYWNGTFDEYTKLYDFTEAALHEVLPAAQLGGPAVVIPSGTFLREFLQHCANGPNAVTGQPGTRLDLITFHAKGGVTIADDHVRMNLGNQLRVHRAGFSAVASVPQFKQTPIYITEADPEGCAACDASDTPAYAYRNSTAYGAYVVAMMKHTLELEAQMGVTLRGLLTWAFTFPGTPYFAGYRVLSTNGIELPVMGAFRLLGRLAGARLPLASSGARPLGEIMGSGVRDAADVDGMAAREGDVLRVLLWNYHDDVLPSAATPVHLVIRVPASFGTRARVTHLRVDESHGDAHAVWVSQGMPARPSVAQRSALEQAMQPSALVPTRTVAVTPNGEVTIDFSLPRFGLSLVTLDAAPADAGVDGDERSGGQGCGCGAAGRSGEATAVAIAMTLAVFGVSRFSRVRPLRKGGRRRLFSGRR